MKTPSKRNSKSWWFHRVFTIAFFVLIWIPMVGMFLDFDPMTAVDEKRQLAAFPGIDGVKLSRENVRTFFNDHIGLRNSMLRLHANVKLAIFKTSNNRVVIGEDGWYFGDFNRAVKAATGRIKLHDNQVENWKAVLSQRADYLDERGIKFAFLMVPDKHYIHGDRLPEYLRDPFGPAVLDQFIDRVSAKNVHLMDVRQELFDAAVRHETFYKGDTHWNGYGVKAGYLGVLRELREVLGPQDFLQPFPVVVNNTKEPRQGDLYRALAIDGSKSDLGTYCRIQDRHAKKVDVPQNYYDLEDEYRLDQRKLCVYENPSCNGPTLVMFHTSFSVGAMRHLLAEHFSRVVYVRHSTNSRLAFHKKIVEQERPEIVINEIPTRYLMMNPLTAYNQSDWSESEIQVASKRSKNRSQQKR